MAKAFSKLSDMMPKLVFRENGSAQGDGQMSLQETNVDMNWVNVDKSQSFKTVFLGDSGVGKTCLAKLFVKNEVVGNTCNTIGFDHYTKRVAISEAAEVQLQIWDTAGMEQFRNALITKYYRNADGVVLVYDITRRVSFENLELWIKEVRQYCVGGLERIRMVLIGNKIDLSHEREVSKDEIQRLVRKYQIVHWVELSSKHLSFLPKLDGVFVTLAQQMCSIRRQTEMTKSATIAQQGVISLSDDWELITAPEHPVPHYAYRAQEQGRRKRLKCSC